MKTILFNLLLMLAFNVNADVFSMSKLSNKVEELHKVWTQVASIEGLEDSKLKELRVELYGNRPNVWNMHPEQLQDMRSRLEPLREMSEQLAKSGNERQRYYGGSFLAYLSPTETTKSILLDLAYDKGHATAGSSLDVLFGMGWDTPELRQELVEDLERIANGQKSQTLAFTNVGKWGVVEAVPVMIKILERTYFDKTIQEKGILRQFRYLGKDAAEALPVLEKILAQRKQDGDVDYRELEALEFAVIAVREDKRIRQESWRNLQEKYGEKNTGAKSLVRTKQDRIEGFDQQDKNKISEVKDIFSFETELSPKRFSWIIAGVLLLGILALLLKTVKGNSRS